MAYNKLKDQTAPPCNCAQMVRKQDHQTRYTAELVYYEPSIFGILSIHWCAEARLDSIVSQLLLA